MEDDDKPVGRVLSRRKALAVFGAAGVTFTAVGTAVTGRFDHNDRTTPRRSTVWPSRR